MMQQPLTHGLLEDQPEAGGPRRAHGTKAFGLLAAAAFAATSLLLVASCVGEKAPLLRGQGATTQLAAGLWSPEQPGLWEEQAYETMLELQMPYMDFAESIYVHSDKKSGLMRLSYYSGADVFLLNTTGKSFELVPVGEMLSCLVSDAIHHVELVIPDLDLFRRDGSYHEITLRDEQGVESVGYEMILDLKPLAESENAHWTFARPVQNFAGRYTFIVNATAGGAPVSLTFQGHNPFLVQSHSDEYRIVYKTFHPRPEGIDKYFFLVPQGMVCTPYDNPTGPFTARRAAPLHDLGLHLPGARGDGHREAVFQELSAHLNKSSCHGLAECGSRQALALRHYRWIQAHNRRGLHYKVGVNHMLDWAPEERSRLLGRRKPMQLLGAEKTQQEFCGLWNADDKKGEPLLERLDWRDHGLVGPPRDQGTCGSCWAFATIGMLEGQVAKKAGGVLTRLSEQHLLDCSWLFGNNACDGGTDVEGLSWVLQQNGGDVATEASYGTYLSENGFCHFDHSKGLEGLAGVAAPPPGAQEHVKVGAHLTSCWHVTGTQQKVDIPEAIHNLGWALVTVGPISVSVTAARLDIYYYEGGVYDNSECENRADHLDHSVLVVGMGRDPNFGMEYWLIRNSWSTHWGEGGYIRIAKEGNICGISSNPAFGLLG